MARKITGIKIDNYRAWYGPYETIHLPDGENLLIYGENGSGKSSFFKALQNFFRSSIDGQPQFELNIFSVLAGNIQGSVNLSFSDYTTNPPVINDYTYTLGAASTNIQSFISDTRKLNSFLDYKHMLGVHFTDAESTAVPNLFQALIEGLLGNYEIPATGKTIYAEIKSIETGLKRRSDSRQYDEAKTNFPIIQGAISQIVTDILVELNRLLNQYFDNGIIVQLVFFQS